MINLLNRVIRFSSFKKKQAVPSKKGQVGVVLILVAAVGLILFAVTMNYSRAAQIKVLTMKGATTSSSMMASFLASYGEQIFRETMRGQAKICSTARTGLLSIIIKFVLIIVAIVIIITSASAAGTAGAAIIAMAVAAGVLAVAGFAMQLAAIQAGVGTEVYLSLIHI